ncbi:MAG: CpsD/CapB family tyrosine-protein kinase [Hyphomicrobiales bacterium]
MERIKEAIERAKAARQKSQDVPSRQRPMAPLPTGRVNDASPAQTAFASVTLDRGHLEANRIVALDGTDPRAGRFDMLRTQVVQRMVENRWQNLAITSPKPGCGKTVTSVNLALSIARQPDRRVLLIDLDLRNPHVAEYLGFQPRYRLLDVFLGEVPLGDALVAPHVPGEGFLVLGNSQPVGNSAELISSVHVREMVSALRRRFADYIIIFDMSPMLSTDDMLAFMPLVDCMMLVAAVGQSSVVDVEECERHIAADNYLGIVLNKAEEALDTYY